MRYYWISLPYATFCIQSKEGKIVDAAPIAYWSVGKDALLVLNYYKKKGAKIVRIRVQSRENN